MKRLSQYITYLADRKAALFMGAGISAIAGCSGLRAIREKLSEIDEIKKAIGSKRIDHIESKEVLTFIKNRCRTDASRLEYEGIMRRSLIPDPTKLVRDYLPFIKVIKKMPQFPPIISTNVDTCLESTLEFDMSRIFYQPKDITINNFQKGGIFHLHGYLEDKKNEVWDLYDYERRYDQQFKDFLMEVFKSYSILYLGYAFGDRELLDQMAVARKDNLSPVSHFALLPDDNFPKGVEEVVYEELYNIKIIKYGPEKDFVNIFSDWVDSNFDKADVGASSKVMFMPGV